MPRPSLEVGYEFWHDEVLADATPAKMVPYISAIALVGVYTTFNVDPDRLTSYHWRQSVLGNEHAKIAFRKSVGDFFEDRMDNGYEIEVERLKPDEDAHAHNWVVYESLADGLPETVTSIGESEEFLAETLGHAIHDQNLELRPLRLIDGGYVSLQNHYPRTYAFLQEHSG